MRPHSASQSQTIQSVVFRMIHGMDSGSQARKFLLPVPEGSGLKSQMQERQCIKNSQRSQLEPSHILPAGRDVHSLLPKGIRGNSLQMGAQPRNYPLPSAATRAKQIKKKKNPGEKPGKDSQKVHKLSRKPGELKFPKRPGCVWR